jgi:hypothetical protein
MTKKLTESAAQFAFWNYDQYPFFLGGTVTHMREDGLIQTKEYGPGHWFRPVLIVPEETGKIMKNTLRHLEEDYCKAQKALAKEFAEKLAKQCPLLPSKVKQ